jgi:DNA-binding NarL/FixJ family response regulator
MGEGNTIGTAVIFEDHQLFAETFSCLLESMELFSQVSCFSSGGTFLDFLSTNPGSEYYLFIDFFIENGNAIHLLSEVRKVAPTAHVIVVSSVSSPLLIRKILSSKVDGFISKVDGKDEIRACLSSIARKKTYISTVTKKLLENDVPHSADKSFTPRELEILALVSKGKSTAEIADCLNLSVHTVMTHRKNMLSKTGAGTITDVVIFAIGAGLIQQG